MDIKEIPYTDKYPVMYQVYLSNKCVVVQSHKKESFYKMIEYIESNNLGDNYFKYPESFKTKLVISGFDIKKMG